MTTISVPRAALPVVLYALGAELTEWRAAWTRFEEDYLAEQQAEWAREEGFGPLPLHRRGFPLAESTVSDRERRKGYYRNAPTSDATTRTVLYWTGALADSTSRFSRKSRTEAEIDTSRTYRGPIRRSEYPDPVQGIVVDEHGGSPWDLQAVDKLLDDLSTDMAERAIAEVARRAFR